MKFAIATFAAAAALAFAVVPASARTAPKEAFVPVPQSVIDAGPTIPADMPDEDWSTAEMIYMGEVCPTVLHSPSQYRANLVQFCKEYRAG